jgi:hypothetical protein
MTNGMHIIMTKDMTKRFLVIMYTTIIPHDVMHEMDIPRTICATGIS